ncbi:MAG: ABC transporter ATP-binding protein [Ardenticatenales bacterium]|nr:ABC transporter ATP-binding protein [Ardenticatenales bacterium]
MEDFKRLLQLAYPHRVRLLLATFILGLGTLLNLAIPFNLRQLVDGVFNEAGRAQLNQTAVTLLAILLLRMSSGVMAGYLLEWTGERIVADLRRRLFAHLIHLDLRFFADTRIGEITSRMSNDVSVIQNAVTSTLIGVIERVLLATGSLSIMFLLNWRLTLAIFVTIPLVVLSSRIFGRYVHQLSREVQERLAAATSVMEESLGAIRIVKIFVREPHEVGRFNHEIESLFERVRRRARLHALYGPLVSMLFAGAMVLVLWLGGQEVLAGRLTPGKMIEFLLYASFIASSVSVFSSAYTTFKRAIGSTERVFELLEQEREIRVPEAAASLAPMRGSIRFEHVSFGYDPALPVLENLSFDIAAGEVVALVGVSGVGKSTLMDLLPRYYDVTNGRILIDGVDIREVKLASLRAGIGSVPQETLLFAATVRDNLRYGRLEASDEHLIAAARAANAHDFIQALPQGYDTLVGERGVKLSGGQRQRIAIARALLKEPALLLLDEATSSLDSESERAVQVALDELLAERGRTTLVIAHRLSTVRSADRILVIAPVEGVGRLVEQGSHQELLARRGVYHQLYTMQFREEEAVLVVNQQTDELLQERL